MLICSFANAQNNPSHKTKKQKVAPKHGVLKQKPDTLQTPLKDTLLIGSNETASELAAFDPMDTVHIVRSKNALSKSVKYNARDSIIYIADKKEIYLLGDAKVFYDDLSLTADSIKIELNKNKVTANYTKDTAGKIVGMPKFKQGMQGYSADRISYNFKSKRGHLSEFKTKEGEGYVRGNEVIKNEYNEFGIRHSLYTTCDADTPHFGITAAKLKVIPDKKAVALWPNLVIEGINTPLVFPFAIFPLKKGQSSGIIIPQYGSDISRGFNLRAGGYYLGLGEHAPQKWFSPTISFLWPAGTCKSTSAIS